MRIQHNIAALNSYRNYTNNTNAVSKNLEKLSSGYRINRAGDDAAGLAISEKMRAQITGLEVAQKNAQDGVSLIQTAEGAMQEVHSMLNRMVELADQSANGTYDNDVDRANLQKEFKALTKEIDRIADATNFNGIDLLNGDMDGRFTADISVAAAGTGAGIDFSFGFEHFETATPGSVPDFQIAFTSVATGTSGATITLNNNGSVIITVQVGTNALEDGLSASEIANLIKESASKGINDDDFVGNTAATDRLLEAIDNMAVYGQGVIGVEGGTAFATSAVIGGLGGSAIAEGDALTLQIGENAKDYNQLKINIKDMHAESLKLDQISVDTADNANKALDVIRTAINTVSSVRGDLGAAQNRLEHTMNNLSVTSENMTAAESRIRDVDVAKEMMSYTKNNILVQSAQAMLAQANQQPQGVLQLLQ